jgi:hypothetical protein
MNFRWISIFIFGIGIGILGNHFKESLDLAVYFMVPVITGIFAAVMLVKQKVIITLLGSLIASSTALLADVVIYSMETDWYYTLHDGETQLFILLIWSLYCVFSLAAGISVNRIICRI